MTIERITENTHTPLNSSIVSWTGDVSHIWDKFKSDDDFYLKKYYKGSDEFYYKEIDYETYGTQISVIQLRGMNMRNLET